MTDKQQLFVREYLIDFNATRAAIKAGYSAKTAYSIGAENLRKPEIKQAIESAINERSNNLLATREQRKEFWTAIMNDDSTDLKHRLRASELLGKSEGDFTDRKEIRTDIGVSTLADLMLEVWQQDS